MAAFSQAAVGAGSRLPKTSTVASGAPPQRMWRSMISGFRGAAEPAMAQARESTMRFLVAWTASAGRSSNSRFA